MSEYKKIDKFGRYKIITKTIEHSDACVAFSDSAKDYKRIGAKLY